MADDEATEDAPTSARPSGTAVPRWSSDDRLVLIGTVLLLFTLPMPWYRTDVASDAFTARGWAGPGVGFTLLAVIAALALSALVLGRLQGSAWAAQLTARAWWLDGVLGGGCLAMLAGRLLWDSTYRSYGFVLALVCSVLVAFGGGAVSLARAQAIRRASAQAPGPARASGPWRPARRAPVTDQGSTQPPAPPPEPAGAPRG
jgi:hypothetical protein